MKSQQQPSIGSLQVALDANAAAYRRAVQTSVPGDCWDFLVLTAANEKQAQGYRQELALRQRAVGPTGAFFPAVQRTLVVPDPPGRRAGSGGATLGVYRALAQEFNLSAADMGRARILLIHSGGASQRLPAYSPLGKIFAPLPLLRPDGQIATLFDHLYLTLAGLPDRLGCGTLILAGDVFLLFDHRHVTAPAAGVTALTMRVEAEQGRGHGVFAIDGNGIIRQTLQKVSVQAMQEAGATDSLGRVLIDTGLLFFDSDRTVKLAEVAGVTKTTGLSRSSRAARHGLDERHPVQLDLYEDITAALAAGTKRDEFFKAPATTKLRRELWRNFHGIPFQAMQLDGQFLHLGTTRQFRDAMIGQNPSPAAELFQQNVLAHSDWRLEAGRRVYHSVLLANHSAVGSLGPGSVVEHSILSAPSQIGAGSVVSQVLAHRTSIDLEPNCLLFQVPVRSSRKELLYVHVLCGVEDDFKGNFAEGKCRYVNQPIDLWMTLHGIEASDIWPGIPSDRRTLWTARLFPATAHRDAAGAVLRLGSLKKASKSIVAAWRKSPRYSMAMMLEMADPLALIEHREIVSAYLQTTELLGVIRRREDHPIESILGHYSTVAAYRAAEQLLSAWAGEKSADANLSLDQARAFWCGAQLLQRPDHPDTGSARARIESQMSRAFAKVAEASEIGYRSIEVSSRDDRSSMRDEKLRPGIQITATSPVRLDLAGGWSDTPPYCFERGGHVVNVAIDLDSHPPVRAVVRTLREPHVILESADLGRQIELKSSDLMGEVDVHDPFALHKVALHMTGLLGHGKGGIKQLGAGLHLITECRVPKGSGLGTSSILGATLLAALHKLRGQQASPESLIEQTLLLEQRLSTGGGWQDQVGGIVGGVKSTLTAPGFPQRPIVEPLNLSEPIYEGLGQRLVVYFSGQQRLARDILRRVMGRWLGREPSVLLLTERLKQSAASLRVALLKGRWTAVAQEIAQYWQIKKELYPGSTTPTIDVLLLELHNHYLAAGLAGAGGGGFAYFFCKDAAQAQRLRDELSARSGRPGSLGAVYAARINRSGLVVAKE